MIEQFWYQLSFNQVFFKSYTDQWEQQDFDTCRLLVWSRLPLQLLRTQLIIHEWYIFLNPKLEISNVSQDQYFSLVRCLET